MRTLWTLTLLAGSLSARQIDLRTVGEKVLPGGITQAARLQIGWMLEKVGVEVRWNPRQVRAGVQAIEIRFALGTPAAFHPGALAYARPFAGGVQPVTVFYDRVRFLAEVRPGLEARLLAHVLVHEIGHVLMENDAHSSAGVMKARWTVHDYDRMALAPLQFTKEERDLLKARP
jgi:hypothetical protein